MKIMLETIRLLFINLFLKYRMALLKKNEAKIEKLSTNLKVELKYRKWLVNDTLRIVNGNKGEKDGQGSIIEKVK